MIPRKIKILVVEDSAVARDLLVHILNADPRLQVMGTATNGEEALEFLKHAKPDLVIMDVHMPRMNGYEATHRIMESNPVPIIVCSASLKPPEVAATFRAMEAGAVALVAKPCGPGHREFAAMASKLVDTAALMAEVKVVRRKHRNAYGALPPSVRDALPRSREPIGVIAIGASTGGPPALKTLLSALPRMLPVPVLVVQHIAAGFLPGLVEWLGAGTGFPVRIAVDGEVLRAGHVYVAPDDCHLGAERSGRVALSRGDREHGLRPAVSHLFRSVAAAYGRCAAGVLLTGMGRDGAAELKQLRDIGGATFAQDAITAVVHGMPGEAIRLGGAERVLPPEGIAAELAILAAGRRSA